MFPITVVTPSLNHGRFLGQCLRSVQLQGWSDVEHLVIDGGSTDDTADVVGRFPFARLVHQPDSSQSDALNWGFANASHRVLCWLNSDDLLMPGAFDELAASGVTAQERFYAYGDVAIIDEHGALTGIRVLAPQSFTIIRNFAVYLPTSGSYFPRAVADDALWVRGDLHYSMDRDFLIRLRDAGYAFHRSRKVLSVFRVHRAQKSHGENRSPERSAEWRTQCVQYGGLRIRGHRIIPWNPAFALAGRAYLGSWSRASRVLDRDPRRRTLTAEIERWLQATAEAPSAR